MSAAEILRAERAAMCDTFDAVGPDAPTLCEGWTTSDLAAHLIVREHRPDSMPGVIIGGPFAGHTAKLMDAAKRKGYDSMIATLRTGLPWLYRVGPGAFANVMENWIHHEDIRRANGLEPRPPDAEVDAVGPRDRVASVARRSRRRGPGRERREVRLVEPDALRRRSGWVGRGSACRGRSTRSRPCA